MTHHGHWCRHPRALLIPYRVSRNIVYSMCSACGTVILRDTKRNA